MPPHHALIVVDLEYASANPRAFDIANHFHEWRADYHHQDLPHLLEHLSFPNREERKRFLGAYVDQGRVLDQELLKSPLLGTENKYSAALKPRSEIAKLSGDEWQSEREMQINRLEEEVSVWSPSSHAMWATWGIVQARDAIMSRIAEAQRGAKLKSFKPDGSVWTNPSKLTIPGTTVRNQYTQGLANGVMDEDVEKWSRDFEKFDKEAKEADLGHIDDHPDRETPEQRLPNEDQPVDNVKKQNGVNGDVGHFQANEEDAEFEETESAGEVEFDYLGYAAHRIHLFREDWARLKRGEPLPQ